MGGMDNVLLRTSLQTSQPAANQQVASYGDTAIGFQTLKVDDSQLVA